MRRSTRRPMEDNVTEIEDKGKESLDEHSHVDSGFLSGGNLRTEEFEDEEEEGGKDEEGNKKSSSCSVAPEPMRVDSGVIDDETSLIDDLTQLHLKPVTLNPLAASTKVDAKPTSTTSETSYDLEPWELYYAQDDDGDTQLHIAIAQGFLEATFSLIQMAPHPCLLNILNDDGQAPLHLAVLARQATVVRRLILAGANPAQRNLRGNTALHLACTIGDIACARALTEPLSLLERNHLTPGKRVPALPQNLEQRNYNGEKCLHIAACGGQVELVRLLLRLGADLEAREGLAGKTALQLAIEYGRASVVAFLLKECRPCLDTPNYAGYTAYQIALRFDRQLARELVRLGARPEPLPETDSDSEDDGECYLSEHRIDTISLRQNHPVVGV